MNLNFLQAFDPYAFIYAAANLIKMRQEAPKEERSDPPALEEILKEIEEEQIL